MADYFYGSISVRKADAEKPEVKALIDAYGTDCSSDGNTVTLEDEQAVNGTFEKIEDALIEMGIPFDRHSTGYCDILPETREYRPATAEHEKIDNIVVFTNNGDLFVRIYNLRDILKQDISADEKLRQIAEEMEENGYSKYSLVETIKEEN